MDTSERTLRLLGLLQTHRLWSGTELAARLDVSGRTLRRDVERLRGLGYAIEAARGVAGGYQLRGSASMPPLLLDDQEALAIALGLRAGAAGAVAGHEEAAVNALAKLTTLMPARLREQVETLTGHTELGPTWSPVDAETLTTVARACRDSELLGFAYTARDGEATTRRVEPHRLVNLGRRWYVVAFDRGRDDWRSFRLDRMEEATPLRERFAPRRIPGGDAVAFVEGGTRGAGSDARVRVRFAAPAASVAEFVGRWADVEAAPDDPGACVMTMLTADLHWPLMVMCAVDAPARVLEPEELVGRARRAGERLRAVAG
ncbi:MAG: YafY family transcriptional regulator [Thermoleophilia bacterium]|nr:YafY family transcriptional regulator [Thermoleophilia bacterium]